MPRKISTLLGTTTKDLESKGVFDGFVDVDSRLHIDPSLLGKTGIKEFDKAEEEFRDYFNNVLTLIKNFKKEGDALFNEAWKRLQFKEEGSTALGYSDKGTRGSGIGEKLALNILKTAKEIIEAEIVDPIIFELVNSKEEPDYEFMEQFVLHKRHQKQKEYQKFVQQRIEKFKKTPKTDSLDEKKWKEFFLKEVFIEIQRGKRLKKSDHREGNQPYISSTGSNNGIDGYVGNKEKVRIFENCITLANSGSVGSCFYQPYSFVASDHVTKLENNDFDKYTNLFLSSVVSRLGEKYSFNREMNDTRIKKEKILLPINDKNEPDYEFMENYMKNLEYKRLTEYLKFKSG